MNNNLLVIVLSAYAWFIRSPLSICPQQGNTFFVLGNRWAFHSIPDWGIKHERRDQFVDMEIMPKHPADPKTATLSLTLYFVHYATSGSTVQVSALALWVWSLLKLAIIHRRPPIGNEPPFWLMPLDFQGSTKSSPLIAFGMIKKDLEELSSHGNPSKRLVIISKANPSSTPS